MEQLKGKVTNLVKEFATSVDEDIEMLNTNGVVLKFKRDAPQETVDWICQLVQKPGILYSTYEIYFILNKIALKNYYKTFPNF